MQDDIKEEITSCRNNCSASSLIKLEWESFIEQGLASAPHFVVVRLFLDPQVGTLEATLY